MHSTALSLVVFASLLLQAEGSWGTGSKTSYNHDLSKKSDLTSLYNSRVQEAQSMTRPLGGLSFQAGPLSHSGVRLTLEDGSQWLVHKGDGYGISSQTVVVPAGHMSSNWKTTETKNVGGTKTVSDYVRDGGENYNLLSDNCHKASKKMMKD